MCALAYVTLPTQDSSSSRALRAEVSRALRVGPTFNSAQSCLRVIISTFAGLSFIDRPPISVGDRY